MTDPTSPAIPRAVSEAELGGLVERLRRSRRIADPWATDVGRGVGAEALAPLVDHWATAYDWRTQERRIRALPWQLAGGEGEALRVLHQPAEEPDAPVVVLLHGWPDSVLRFERLLPLLTDVHVVVPALPGFPFALERSTAASVEVMAQLVSGAVSGLGYRRVVVSGGDVGGDVAEIMASTHPQQVAAMHPTNVSPRHALTVDAERLSADSRAYLATAGAWFRDHGGYILEQSTRPSTLIAALGDSPVGLAAWIIEKLRAWSDDVATSFSDDELLTWVCAYWFSGTIGTSFSTYVEPASVPDRTKVPTVVSTFAADTKPAPRSYLEAFVDLRANLVHDAGGHFAAWEQPEAYATDLRRAVTFW